jgi:ParB family chromosome partitioning protein
VGDESWSERRQAGAEVATGTVTIPARAGAVAEHPPAAKSERSVTAPHFAAAGQVIGRRRTVFAAVPIAVIKPNPLQPRQHFDEQSIEELAESIRARGLLQPIIVRRERDGGYTLIAGERRLRAAERAGVGLVPAILSDDDLLEVALEENVQREDLSPLEEAEALAALAAERNLSHADLAQVIHKSRPYVSNTLALTRLPREVKQEYFSDGAVVAREILISIARQETPEAMRALWKRVRLESISVRSFRERAAKREPAPANEALRAARKLGRALRALDTSALDAAEARVLRRALARVVRRVADTLAVLDEANAGADAVNTKPRPADARSLRVAHAASAGVGRVPTGTWSSSSTAERFRRSS